MRKLIIFVVIVLCNVFIAPALGMEKIFYTLRGEQSADYSGMSHLLETLSKHRGSVDMIISQAYQIDNHGTVWGAVNSRLLDFTRENNIKFMALVTNANFDPHRVTEFLSSYYAQSKAIASLIALCQQNNFYGIQLDFEDVNVKNRSALTAFYKNLANAMHRHGFKVSAALFPVTTDVPQTGVLERLYNNWGASEDYKTIGKYSDFVTIMAYNQHTGGTTPGPNAGLSWVKQVIQYAVHYIPASKVSLGIPDYSAYWQMAMIHGVARPIGKELDYQSVQELLRKNNTELKWDNVDKVPYTFYSQNQFNEYIFAEDAQSFEEKLKLVKKFRLRGFSLWREGMEDPKIWGKLESSRFAG